MSINTTKHPIDHAKSIISLQLTGDALPFHDVLSKDSIEKHVPYSTGRNRIFTPDVTLYTFLAQVISADQSCQAAVAGILAKLALQGSCISANTSAYCKARFRLSEETLSGLTKESAQQLEQEIPKGWLWHNRNVQLIDGTCVSMPDTVENQTIYPQPNTQKKAWDFRLFEWLGLFSWQRVRYVM